MKVYAVHSMFISYDNPDETSLNDIQLFPTREEALNDIHNMVEEFKNHRNDIQDIDEEGFYAIIYFENNDYWEAQLQEINFNEKAA